MNDKPNIVTQPHLGRVKDNYRPSSEIGGYLTTAKIIKIHHKYRTADIAIIGTRDIISSGTTNEGKFGARILSSSASFDSVSMAASGTIEPLQEGAIVIVAFLDGSKSKPIILGTVFNTDNTISSMLPDVYPLDPNKAGDERKEALKYLKVFPSQLYHRVDGEGGVEISHPSGTFLKIDADRDQLMNDEHDGFSHDDLMEKDSRTNEVRKAPTEEAMLPVSMLFSHQTNMDSAEDNSWTKFFLSSEGMFRTTKDTNDGKLTYTELSEDGTYTIRRQNDSDKHGLGTQYSEISLAQNGDISIKRQAGGQTVKVAIGSDMKVAITGDVSISGNMVVSGTSTSANSFTRGSQVLTFSDPHGGV